MLVVRLKLERLDQNGKLLQRREQYSHSFTKGFIELLYIAHVQIQSDSPYSMTDINGSARDIDGQAITSVISRGCKSHLQFGAPSGQAELHTLVGTDVDDGLYPLKHLEGQKVGIQVGTGTNAVTPTDTTLQTRIAHGRGTGQLEYGGCELVGIAFSDPNGEFTLRRYFTNHSGGSITVNEVGIYAIGTKYATSYTTLGAWSFLIARDIVSPGVAVANTELLRVTYVPQITV